MSQSRDALGYIKYRGDCLLAYDRAGNLLGSFSQDEAYAAVSAVLTAAPSS